MAGEVGRWWLEQVARMLTEPAPSLKVCGVTTEVRCMQISGGNLSPVSLTAGSYISGNFPFTQEGTERAEMLAEIDAARAQSKAEGEDIKFNTGQSATWANLTQDDEEMIYRVTGERIDHSGNHPQSLFAYQVADARDRGMTTPIDADYLNQWLDCFEDKDPNKHLQAEAVQHGLDYLKTLMAMHSGDTAVARHALGV